MKPFRTGTLMLVVAVLPALAGFSRASFQAVDRAYWLGVGSWQLCEKDGTVCLVMSAWDHRFTIPDEEAKQWVVSVPTIRDAKGKYLASDPAGRSPSVRLVEKAGDNTRWVFEIVKRLEPGREIVEGKGFKSGPSGFTFRVKMDAGPFKGWYLAAEEEKPRGEKPGVRAVKLVRGVKQATVFTYIEANYYVGSK
jgi:hypothetical protein